MGERTRLPSAAAIARAEELTREVFLHPGETKTEALAPGTPRRRALDAALAEVKEGLSVPSLQWRHEWSLLLGLERVLSEDEPRLADGTVLNPHQVDALSGTLTALLAQTLSASGAADPAGSTETPSPNGGAAAKATGRGASERTVVIDEDAVADAEELVEVEVEPEAGGDDEADDDEDEDDDEEHDPDEFADVGADDDDEDEDDEDDDAPEHDDDEPRDFDEDDAALDSDVVVDADDPGADRRFWFEHATGAGKTVAAMGFVAASRTGGVLILTHRRNLVDQFIDEIKTRGYRDRLCKPLLIGEDSSNGPVTVETYQWFVRNAGKISDAYTVVICDEAHTALGEKTSAQIRSWDKPIWIGMTATGALIARHVTDLFPTQTSRFDLAQAARRGVISPLRCIRIPPGVGVRTIAKVPLRRGEVDTEFDQEMLAELLDQTPFNLAIADLYKTRFNGLPGVVYAAGVKHAYNVAEAFRSFDMKAMAVSGETPKRELAKILADYEAGKIDVLVNAQLLAEGWNSPRATVCMHLAPTASKRIYQQRVGRVTRRHPGKEAGIVIDFVHPATKHDDPVVTLHSLLDRDVYRGGAIVIGPVRRGRGRRIRVERRVLPVTPDPERRAEVFERELWRIAVENLDYGEQHVWAALAGARVQPNGWRRAKAMLHFDRQGELRRRFLVTTLERNRSPQLKLRALSEIAASRDAEAFDQAIDLMATWAKDDRREGVKIMLLALAERRIGRRDQANAWIWRMAEYTRDVHEEYAAQRWPETKRLLGLLVNSSGSAHARNARRLVHATRTQDRRLSAALLAAALAHTPEAEEALRGARTRMARKPAALARELLRNFPKGKKSSKRRRKTKTAGEGTPVAALAGARGATGTAVLDSDLDPTRGDAGPDLEDDEGRDAADGSSDADTTEVAAGARTATRRRTRSRARARKPTAQPEPEASPAAEGDAELGADAAPGADSGPSADSKPGTGSERETPAEPAATPKRAPRTRTRRARSSTPSTVASEEAPDDASPVPEPATAKTPTAKTPTAKTPAAKTPAAKTPAAATPAAETDVAVDAPPARPKRAPARPRTRRPRGTAAAAEAVQAAMARDESSGPADASTDAETELDRDAA